MSKRTYEVSIWTLQDDFVTVLKPSEVEWKGQIQDNPLTIKLDGTQEFSFSIPMYLWKGRQLVENPLWYHTQNGDLIANMRKVKVILNKGMDDEKVFEFIIIKTEERHEKDEVYCDVTCEGLAFHELGKIGYKIVLAAADYEYAHQVWEESDRSTPEPVANIDFWMALIPIQRVPTTEYRFANQWYYTLDMHNIVNMTSANVDENQKVYEDAYVTSWDVSGNELVASNIQTTREKQRNVDIDKSNIYNITQKIAEIFGVYCRYEYEYDENYHIISRTIVFYNNFFYEQGADQYLDINYPFNTDSIKRTLDSTDLVTKMFVNMNDNTDVFTDIMTVDVNPTKEDYLLDFDYMYENGTISTYAYNEIPKYEAKIRKYNDNIYKQSRWISYLDNQITEVSALYQEAKDGQEEANKVVDECSQRINSIGNGGKYTHTNDAPEICPIIRDATSNYINLPVKGIDASTIKVYVKDTTDVANLYKITSADTLITNFNIVNDDLGFPSKIVILASGDLEPINSGTRNTRAIVGGGMINGMIIPDNPTIDPEVSGCVDAYCDYALQKEPAVYYDEAWIPADIEYIVIPEPEPDPTPDPDPDPTPEPEPEPEPSIDDESVIILDDEDIPTEPLMRSMMTGPILRNGTSGDSTSGDNTNGDNTSGDEEEVTVENLLNTASSLYLTYTYDVQSYWTTNKQTYQNLSDKLAGRAKQYEGQLENYTMYKNSAEERLLDNRTNKTILVDQFQRMMGPALREGNWSPEDYTDYGKNIDIVLSGITAKPDKLSNEDIDTYLDRISNTCFWDPVLFNDEQDIYYEEGVLQVKTPYLVIDMGNYKIDENYNWAKDKFKFIYYDEKYISMINSFIDNVFEEQFSGSAPAYVANIVNLFSGDFTTSGSVAYDANNLLHSKHFNYLRYSSLGSDCHFCFVEETSGANAGTIHQCVVVTDEKLTNSAIKTLLEYSDLLQTPWNTLIGGYHDISDPAEKLALAKKIAFWRFWEMGETKDDTFYRLECDHPKNNFNRLWAFGQVEVLKTSNGNTYFSQFRHYPVGKNNLWYDRLFDPYIMSGNKIVANTDALKNYRAVYPRFFIHSLKFKENDKITVKQKIIQNNVVTDTLLERYADYSVLYDANPKRFSSAAVAASEGYYLINIKPTCLVDILKYTHPTQQFSFNYFLSTAAESIYLDAIKILKENSQPKVTYEVNITVLPPSNTKQLYNMLAQIVHINDIQLKFEDVRGYISEAELNLSKPSEDKIVIQNYKNKFEDLFSSIVAQSEAMQKSENIISSVPTLTVQVNKINNTIQSGSMVKYDNNLNQYLNNYVSNAILSTNSLQNSSLATNLTPLIRENILSSIKPISLNQEVVTATQHQSSYKMGDIWKDSANNNQKYIAIKDAEDVSDNENPFKIMNSDYVAAEPHNVITLTSYGDNEVYPAHHGLHLYHYGNISGTDEVTLKSHIDITGQSLKIGNNNVELNNNGILLNESSKIKIINSNNNNKSIELNNQNMLLGTGSSIKIGDLSSDNRNSSSAVWFTADKLLFGYGANVQNDTIGANAKAGWKLPGTRITKDVIGQVLGNVADVTTSTKVLISNYRGLTLGEFGGEADVTAIGDKSINDLPIDANLMNYIRITSNGIYLGKNAHVYKYNEQSQQYTTVI